MSKSEKMVLYWPRGIKLWEEKLIYGKGDYLDGKRDGLWRFWYKNGHKQLEGTYSKGNKNGTWKKWTVNGAKMSEGEFLYGKMNGTWIDWYENGGKALESHWVLGKRDGTWTYWDKDGTVRKKETYDHRQEKDLGYSIHTDLEMKQIVKEIQQKNLHRTWKKLVGSYIADLVKPWHIALWLLLFVPSFALLEAKTKWRGAVLAAVFAFVITSLVAWISNKKNPR